MSALARGLTRVAGFLAARKVAPESVSLAAVVVSVVAGVVLAAGGVAREPRLWLLVPSLGMARLALYLIGSTLEGALVDCGPYVRRSEERDRGQW